MNSDVKPGRWSHHSWPNGCSHGRILLLRADGTVNFCGTYQQLLESSIENPKLRWSWQWFFSFFFPAWILGLKIQDPQADSCQADSQHNIYFFTACQYMRWTHSISTQAILFGSFWVCIEIMNSCFWVSYHSSGVPFQGLQGPWKQSRRVAVETLVMVIWNGRVWVEDLAIGGKLSGFATHCSG